jgi:hypothetical protein
MRDALLRLRPEFPILEQSTYLISNSFEGDFPSVRCLQESLGKRENRILPAIEECTEVSRELNARDVVVDYRPGVGIRMSPHFHTDDDELDRAFEVVDGIRASGASRRFLGQPAVVT